MITYEPFWKTLKEKNQSTYTLISVHGLSSSTVNRLRHNQPINTTTLDDLCKILDCNIEQIIRYFPDAKK